MPACAPVEPGQGRRRLGYAARNAGALLPLLGLLVLVGSAHAQKMPRAEKGSPIDAAKRALMVDRVSAALNEIYVFPETAKKMEAHIRQKLQAGAYDRITSSVDFAEALTRDLREISKDRHLGVEHATEPPPVLSGDKPDPAVRERMRRMLQADNFGFHKVERLPGNVGYLDLRRFVNADLAGDTAVAAMGFLANSDAVIIDLRRNGGGDPSMIQLISSYLFEQPVHLNSFYIRRGNTTEQFWTSAYVHGKRLTHADVYVLTSSFTFSAAEEFTYNLKNLKRATIVGETTGGGAHPVEAKHLVDLNLTVKVPFGRAVNPITGTNWEGTGVAPDLKVPADRALETAHVEALKRLRDKATDEGRKLQLAWTLEQVEALQRPVSLQAAALKSYVGTFGNRTVTLENGALYYRRENRPKLRMIPMTQDTFLLDGVDFVRIKIERDASGRVTGLVGLYADGSTDRTPRTGG